MAEQAVARTSDLKSVYIYNFIRFTDWPESARQQAGHELKLNVLNDAKTFASLQTILDKPQTRQLGLTLHSCKQEQCIKNSSVLFIGAPKHGHFGQLLELVEGQPVLTISDIPGFAAEGGMIEIKYHNEKLTFVVNLQAVKKAGLYISAQLLQFGEVVGRDHE